MLPAVLVAARFFTAPGIWWLGKNDFERSDFATLTRSWRQSPSTYSKCIESKPKSLIFYVRDGWE
jgi:hypothetical protein